MRRTLYIGLGGTGIKVIDEVKKQIISTHGNVPPMIKFLGIDADMTSLSKSILDAQERLFISSNNAYQSFLVKRNEYDDFPTKNAHCLLSIHNSGAGQIRSNAYFLFLHNRRDVEFILRRMYCELSRLYDTTTIKKYKISASAQIDVHLCLSLCGGFGSGIYLEISRLIKEIIPNSNIIVYAFSHKFFMHVGVNRNLKPNCYASLIEADYLLYNEEKERARCLFDKFFYLDNSTYSFNQTCGAYIVDYQYAIKNIAAAMVMSGEIMADCSETFFKILWVESRLHDVVLDNNKKAWVSSMGYARFEVEDCTSMVDYIEVIPEEELDRKIIQMVNRAAPLMEINSFGYILHMSQINYLIVSKNADCIVRKIQDSLRRIGVSTYDLNYIPIIHTNNKNQIALYREIHSIPPYFIKGISKGRNGISERRSCESEFIRVSESGHDSPFSRQSFEDAVLKNGFSLQFSGMN